MSGPNGHRVQRHAKEESKLAQETSTATIRRLALTLRQKNSRAMLIFLAQVSVSLRISSKFSTGDS